MISIYSVLSIDVRERRVKSPFFTLQIDRRAPHDIADAPLPHEELNRCPGDYQKYVLSVVLLLLLLLLLLLFAVLLLLWLLSFVVVVVVVVLIDSKL